MSETRIEKVGILNKDNAINQGTQIGEQHNYVPEQQKTLAEAAKEIQELLEQLVKTYPTETPSQKAMFGAKVVEAIEENPTFKARVISALKAGGITALQEAVDNPLFNVVSAFLEGFIEKIPLSNTQKTSQDWSDFIGCIDAEPDLSRNYKTYLSRQLDGKYDNR